MRLPARNDGDPLQFQDQIPLLVSMPVLRSSCPVGAMPRTPRPRGVIAGSWKWLTLGARAVA
jgi:hypothetical protein